MNKRQAIMKSLTGKHSESPIGFEPLTFCYQLDPLTTELHTTPGDLGHVLGSIVTCALPILQESCPHGVY